MLDECRPLGLLHYPAREDPDESETTRQTPGRAATRVVPQELGAVEHLL